jgi:DNA-binding NtrC family response regulator
MLTKLVEVSNIVDSIKAGAFHYVIKGTESLLQELGHVAELAIEDARMRSAVAWMAESSNGHALDTIVGAAIRCAGDTIQAHDLGYQTYDTGEEIPEYDVAKERVLSQFQRQYVSHLLRATGVNALAAASRAGIARKTLYEILKKLKLDPDDFRT